MAESCENYLFVILDDEVGTKNEDVSSKQNDFQEKGLLELLTDAMKMRDENTPETESEIYDRSKKNFFRTTQSTSREVRRKQIHVQRQDIALVGESVSSANACNSVNCEAIRKKKDCMKDEGKGDLSPTEDSGLSLDNDSSDSEHSRSFQTTLGREELNKKCGKDLDFVSKGGPRTGSCSIDLQRRTNHNSSCGTRSPEVPQVPKDSLPRLKDDLLEPKQGRINSNPCQPMSKREPQFRTEIFMGMNVLRKLTERKKHLENCSSENSVKSGKHAEDSVRGKWNSCTLCPAQFRFMHCLRRHAAVDHDEHLCSECPSTFQCRTDLQTHLKTHRTRKQYCCVFCSFKCQVEAELKVHSRIHSSEKFFSCAQCHVMFDKSHALLDHVGEHVNKESFSCLRCPARFDDATSLVQHSAIHSNEKLVLTDLPTREHRSPVKNDSTAWHPFQSRHYTVMQPISPSSHDHCYAELRESPEKERHSRTYTAKQPPASGQDVLEGEVKRELSYADNVAEFKTEGNLAQLPPHSNGKPLSCAISATQSNTKEFEPHSKTFSNEKFFSCSQCDAKFKSERGFKVHMTRSHLSERPYACKKCTATLKLKSPSLAHSREGLFVCAYCGVEFKYKARFKCVCCEKFCSLYSSLLKHQQFFCSADEDTRRKNRLNCDYCEKTFFFAETFKLHLQTHTLPYKCQVCEKAFSRQWLLKGHSRTHTGERPFFCRFCDRTFADRSNLRMHLLTHKTEKKYRCPTCGQSFFRMAHLNIHTSKVCPRPTPQDDPSTLLDDKGFPQPSA